MDPRDRADALLARAQARGGFVVTPDNATSPMDSSSTQQIPRSVVTELDRNQDPDDTTVLPASLSEENDQRLEFGSGRRPQPAPPAARRPEPDQAEDIMEESHSGLIPTITQTSGRSNLSRRLDGI
jgi:hypothetical protein